MLNGAFVMRIELQVSVTMPLTIQFLSETEYRIERHLAALARHKKLFTALATHYEAAKDDSPAAAIPSNPEAV
ncbi:hypothetical protein V495_04751 [Pseudogymnoascus sp. VKM F-4514 (FW-929)]|nr:hypothetical protein V495_04751 [Pseudogymnoascus sp. VKM F-4514 (FW-929)]KFY60247.1 hypothetical protein V497_03760 [Pseudogymnoascus sp. VKM F-4516 (FW-969)]